MKPALALIGGFLGAGKTTLILAAARILGRQGLRVAAILNDQGDGLVDTHLAQANSVPTDQVTGGCFCCRFPDLLEAAGRLERYAPDVIFAEAVGSCTDIVATTLRPLQRDYAGRFRLAPFTVVVDPQQAETLTDPDLTFLFCNQLAEADLIVETKSDLRAGTLPNARSVSARTTQGVAEWPHEILNPVPAIATARLDLDYARYARAEAALAWLNARVTAHAAPPLSPAMTIGPLLDRLNDALTAAGVRIVHLKVMDECASGYLKAAQCANNVPPEVEGALDASPSRCHDILLNLRALADPDILKRLVQREFAALPARLEWRHLESFRPAPPVPHSRVPWNGEGRP